MKNQIINIPATTFTGLANHFRNMHPEGIKGAVDVHSPDFYEDAKRFAYVEGDSDGGRVSAVWAILPSGEIATLVKNPGAVVPLDDVFGSIRQQGGKWLFVHRYYLTPAECETYEAGRHMVCTYDDGLNLVLKLVSRV